MLVSITNCWSCLGVIFQRSEKATPTPALYSTPSLPYPKPPKPVTPSCTSLQLTAPAPAIQPPGPDQLAAPAPCYG